MAEFVHLAGWTQYNHPTAQNTLSHLRSLSSTSSNPAQRSLAGPVSKSILSSAPHDPMAAVVSAPGIPASRSLHPYADEDGSMSTLPDPRSRAMSPATDSSPSTPSHHPDLSNEVATLSNKLINAINHQTNLDDTLSATRHELETAKERIRQLEQENKTHSDMVTRGILVKRSTVDVEKARLKISLEQERKEKAEIESQKKNIEQELENLTAALFEEANKMVSKAREDAQKEHDVVQKRNDSLKAQLEDTETLLKSHQEQLAELKQVMEQMTEERDDQTNQTAPSSPGVSKFDSRDDMDDGDAVHSASIAESVSPIYPTGLTHLLHMVLRTDLSSYDDFTSLLRMSKNVPPSRVSSGSYGNIGLGIGLGNHTQSTTHVAPTNGSSSSLATTATLGSSPATPTTPASTVSTTSTNGPNSLTPLKETKFYKRALAEDIEPTLRLDTAPGLSWLARRNVLNAVCEGTLVVEPMPASTKIFVFACSLCGESRKGRDHVRTHRFRTSENENAQRYPLCKYCLGRVRSTCDFLGFLRILKDGHWRTDDEESEKSAWEESVRLREQMFWCRIGGGVVPVHNNHPDTSRSPRVIEDDRKVQERKLSEDLESTGEIHPKDITPVHEPVPVDVSTSPNLVTKTEKAAIEDDTAGGLLEADVKDAAVPTPPQAPKESETVDAPSEDIEMASEIHKTNRDSTQSNTSLTVASGNESELGEAKRLSITIPGSIQ